LTPTPRRVNGKSASPQADSSPHGDCDCKPSPLRTGRRSRRQLDQSPPGAGLYVRRQVIDSKPAAIGNFDVRLELPPLGGLPPHIDGDMIPRAAGDPVEEKSM